MTDTTSQARIRRFDAAYRSILFFNARTVNTFGHHSYQPASSGGFIGIWKLARWAPMSAIVQASGERYVNRAGGRSHLLPDGTSPRPARTAAALAVGPGRGSGSFRAACLGLLPFRPELAGKFAEETTRIDGATFNAAWWVSCVNSDSQGRRLGDRRTTTRFRKHLDNSSIDTTLSEGIFAVAADGERRGLSRPDGWRQHLPRVDHAEVVTWS